MSASIHESGTRSARSGIPTLSEIFWGKLANGSRRLAEWRKKGVLGQAFQEHRRRAIRLEALEPRLLLSADLPFDFASHSGVSDIEVSFDGTNILIVDTTGIPATLSSQSPATTSAIRIAGSNGAEHVTVDLSNPFDLPVFFDDNTASDADTLAVTGKGLHWTLTGGDAGHADGAAGIFFSGVEALVGDATQPDEFTFEAGAISTDGVDGGAGDFDALRFGSSSPVTLTNILLGGSQTIANFERAFIEAPSVNAASFSGQVFLSSAVANWVEQGPQPYTQILDGATVPWDPVVGAIQTIAIDPNDRFTVYIGTTNGGVWRNTGSTQVFFDLSDSTLDDTDRAEIDKFAKFLLAHPDVKVEIGGHTDSSGDAPANQNLSVDRAKSVRDYLVNTWQISTGRLTVVGFGEDRPIALNDVSGHQPLNRRVEMLVQNWEPVTQDFPSLSIGSIAIGTVDSQTIYAGTSRTSSFGRTGSVPDGLLFSSDAGDHWRLVSDPMLDGLLITKVLPTTMTPVNAGAEVVFLSTFDTDADKNGVLDDRGGVFRLEVDADGTLAQIEKVSEDVGFVNGLPKGHYTDLAFDPGDGGPREPAVYAATPKQGIFKFTEAAGVWAAVNTGVQLGDTDGVGGDDLFQSATRIRLAVHEASGVLYAGFIGTTNANGIFNLAGKELGLIGLFKTTDGAANWTPMAVPTTVDNGVTSGLHPGGQGDTHFSIAVDPTNSNVVYVGGDAQPSNSVTGQSVQAGRIFRFNPGTGQWVQVIGNNAANTAPHADSRGIIFAGDFTLLEIDDGGLYRLQNPRSDADQGTRKWASLNRGMAFNEVLGAAFDTLNNSVQTGSQDDGSAIQVGIMDNVDNDADGQIDEADERFFWQGTGGDGNSQAAIGVDTNSDTIVDRTLRYALHNNFSFLQVYEVNALGQFVNTNGVPTASAPFTTIGFRSGPGAKALSGLNAQDQALGFDKIPMVVNSVTPTRMLIGYFGIYESINTNINPTAGQTRVLPLDQVRQLDPAVGANVPKGSQVTALVFGGVESGTPNAEVVLAARGKNVLFRSAASGPNSVFQSSAIADAKVITALAVDPDDWKVVYAADAFNVYRNADITNPSSTWVKISGNLNNIGQSGIRSLQFVETGGVDVLLVGGRSGVTRLFDPGTADDKAVWTRFGENLPNAPVFTLQYIDSTQNGLTADDVLLAGTLGRGAWTMAGDSLMNLGTPSVLTVLGRNSTTDDLSLTIERDNPLQFDISDASDPSSDPAFSARFASFSSITVDTRDGADALTVDHTFGAVAVPGGIDYDGGAGSDTLTLDGGPVASHVTTVPIPGVTLDTVNVGGNTELVRSKNLESPVVDNIPTPLTDAFDVFAGAFDSLVGLLTFRDGLAKNVPVFGTSLGSALNGVKAETGEPLGEKEGGATVPLSEQVEEASGQTIDLLRRFVETGTGAFSIDDIANFTTLGDLVTAFQGLDESGTGTVTSSGTLGTGFEITLSGITKKLTGEADVDIDLDISAGSVHLHGLVDISADVTLNLIFGLNNTDGFYVKSTGTQEVVISGIEVEPGQDAVAEGEFGFLGVTVSDLVVAVDPVVHFDIDLADAKLTDLASNPAAYTTVTLVGNGASLPKDVSVTGTFDVAVLIPGLDAPFSLGLGDAARATIAWTDITAAQLNASSNVSIGPAAGSALGDTLMEFLKIDVQDFASQLTALKANLDDVFGAEVPFLSDGLTELVDLVTTFQHKVIDPISGLNGNPSIPSIQSLVSTLAQKLGLTPDQMGLAYNPANGELTYHLVLNESLVSATKDLGAGVDFAGGLADLEFNSQATLDGSVVFDVVFGVDVDEFIAGGDPLDSFFLRNAQAALQTDVSASDIEASARFGFLSIGIDQGALTSAGGSGPGQVFVNLALKDPGTNTNDGRVDLSEIGDNLDDLGKLVTVTGGGSLQLVLPVETSFVPGLLDIPDGTPTADLLDRAITVTVPDLAMPSTIDVALGSGLTDVGNFKNIDAASLVGVLGQLTFWLDQFRHSDQFASFDVPLVGPALDQVLGFADSFRDKVLIDDNDNQLDDAKTLLFDINAALDKAGLGRRLYAANDDSHHIRLVALDNSITAFTVAGATALGFLDPQNGTVPGGEHFAKAVAGSAFGDLEGNLASDLSFTITIDSKTYTVDVKKADTDANTRIGDDQWKLVNGQNAPTFSTAQEMAVKLLDVFGIDSVQYHAGDQTLTFSLDLSEEFGELSLPLGFSLDDNLPDFLKLQTNGQVKLKAAGALNLEVGVFLGPAEPSDKLSSDKPLSELTDPVVISTDQRIVAPNELRTVYGQLSGDAKFTLAVTGDAAITAPIDIIITQAAAANNVTALDLVADINAALLANDLNGKIEAQADGLGIELVKAASAVLTGFSLSTTTTDPAVKDIGLPAAKTAAVDSADGKLKISATKDLAALRGRLTGSASFDVSLDNVNGGSPFHIELTPAQTATNRYAFDIVNDIVGQFSPAWYYDITDPVTHLPTKALRLDIGISDGHLVFTAKGGASTFTISNVAGTAAAELGLANATGNSHDLTITQRDGSSHDVTLDGATTIGDVINKIQDQVNNHLAVTINARGSGLDLTDTSTNTGGQFKVKIANNSTAGLQLGIVREDAGNGEDADGKIQGADIAALTALDRFFIKATPDGEPALGAISVDISTPVPVSASAKFGFVGLELEGAGALPGVDHNALEADLSFRLKEPVGSTDGRVSLAELVDSLGDIGSLFDLSLTGQGKLDLSLKSNMLPALTDLGITTGVDPKIVVDVTMGNVLAGATPSITFTPSGFGDLASFGNVKLSWQSILQGLVALVDFLDNFEALGFLSTPLPVIDVSVKDLVSIADKFGTAVDQAQQDPAGTLQGLENKLLAAFGLPPGDPTLDLKLVTVNGTQILKVELNLGAAFSKSLGLNLDLGDTLPFDLGGSADLLAAGAVNLDLDFGFQVDDPTNIFVFDTTGVAATLNLAATQLNFQAAAGPFGVFVDNGSALLHGSVGGGAPANTAVLAGFQNAGHPDGMFELGDLSFDDLSVQVAAVVDVDLPVSFPTETLFAGTVKLDGSVSYNSSTGQLNASLVPSALDENGADTTLASLFTFDPGNLSLLDKLVLGVDGVDTFLEGLQDLLDGNLGGFKLPLIGDKLSGAADVIGDFRSGFVEKFRKAMEDLANPSAAFAAAGYAPNAGAGAGALAAPTDRDPISKLLYELLKKNGGLGFVDSIDDIEFITNVNQAGLAPKDVDFEWKIHMDGVLLNAGGGIGFDLGIPGLGLETEGAIDLDIGWALDFGFGINLKDGFYLDVGDNSELELNARVTMPGLGITGTLGFLQVNAKENPDDPRNTSLTADFAIDIVNRQNDADDKLGFAELGSIGIDAKIAAQALADLRMRLSLSSDLVPNAATNFPSVVADFLLDWDLGSVGDPLDSSDDQYVSFGDLGGSFLKNGLQFVGFDHVGLDLGTYFSDLIGPIVAKVQEVTEPIKPFLDFLTEPIPVISDLAGPTSLLDIAAMSGLVNPGLIKAIEVVDQVVDIANSLKSGLTGEVILYFDQYLPDGLVIYDANAPLALAASGPGLNLSGPVDLDKLKSIADSLPDSFAFLGDALEAVGPELQEGLGKMLPGGGASEGFKLPIIEDPSQIFGMLLGQPADLVTYEMAPLELQAEFSAFFSIFGPLGVSINAEFNAQFGPFKFGYDTFGISEFAAGDFKNPLQLFDGLYVSDLDAKGNDVPELQFDAGLWAAAELNLGIARGGVGGGLFANIDFDLHDPDQDGRVRIKEIVTNVVNEFRYGTPALSPLAMFDVTGKLTAELFAFLKIDIPFFPIDEKFLITDPITLLDFESHFVRVPTLATELGGGVLQLNMGKFASQRVEGDLTDFGEKFVVYQGSDANHVKVWSPLVDFNHNTLDDNDEAQEYEATKLILALGGEGDDTIDLSGVTSNVAYEVEGNAGNDKIWAGTTGIGAAKIQGGAGNDELHGGAGDDTIFGETGDDTLWGGDGRDWLFGDGKAKDIIQGDVITVAVKSNDGIDELHGEGGDDLLIGGGGQDLLEGGAANDVLIGDGGQATVGSDRLVKTRLQLLNDAFDDVTRYDLAVDDTSKTGKGAKDVLKGEGGDDRLYGGFGDDDLQGGDNNDVIYGELGVDTIDAGGGDDVVFGDGGTFVKVTVGATTTLEPEAAPGGEKDTIFGGDGNDKLLGGGGNDVIHGGIDNDTIFGGIGIDELRGDDGNDTIFGDADSDKLYGGIGDDYLEGGGGNDLVLGGAGDDTLVAGYGSDTLDGEDGGDLYRITARGGPVTELSTALDTGTAGTDTLYFVGTQTADTVLLRAMADSYFPTLDTFDAKLFNLIDRYYNSTLPDKLAAMLQAFNDAYGPHDLGYGMADALTAAFQNGLLPGLKTAIDNTWQNTAGAPTPAALKTLVEQVFNSKADSKLAAMEKAITAAYVEKDVPVPNTMFDALRAAYQTTATVAQLQNAIKPYYVAESLFPALAGLQQLLQDVFDDPQVTDKLAGLEQALKDAYGSFDMEDVTTGMLAALETAFTNDPSDIAGMKLAIAPAYQPDPVSPSAFTNTAFIALINNGGANVERFNYRLMEGIVVNTLGGDDYVVLDDLLAAATINLGQDNDRVQVGQVFRSERVKDFGDQLITGITAEDVFTTVEITRGWLSNGVSVPTTINGGEGEDNFTVFHNVAVLNLNGGDGDDVFTVRAFALKGSTDNERARTDMKGDGGADTILYVINAPVGIDGGDGFDTVRIVGTEFGDDFVITDSGIFGAGLNVTYVNIEKLVADGAEGDDRFFVLSTGLDVVTEIDGGLGSDTFFAGGNPSRAPIPVVSNDLRGHSGVILHSVTSTNLAWNGLQVEGLSANVGDDEESMILMSESGGTSTVFEGGVSGEGWAYDTYTLSLTHAPAVGKWVVVTAVAAGMSPEEEAKNFKDLEFQDPVTLAWSKSLKVTLNGSNWKGVQVKFRAIDDSASEGRRFTFINHKIDAATTDFAFIEAQARSVKVQMDDNDRDGVLIIPTQGSNRVLEGGFIDTFDVVLTRAPLHDVTVNLSVPTLNNQVTLSDTSFTFTPLDWNTSTRTVTVTAKDDGTVEGFHTDYISYTVTSDDGEDTITPQAGQQVLVSGQLITVTAGDWFQVDGDFDKPLVQAVPASKPTSYVLLPNRPDPATVHVRIGGVELASNRYDVSGNTVSFKTANGAPELVVGTVEVRYSYKEPGYSGFAVKDSVVDIIDNDTPTVIVEPVNDGMVDVVEGVGGVTDTYRVRLASDPGALVTLHLDSVDTRTTWGGTAYFEKQVQVNGVLSTTLDFTGGASGSWDDWQVVTVSAYEDTRIDGNDTQVFAPDLQTVNKIRGPLVIDGAAGAGSLSLPAPLMMPWEKNIRPSDGNVVAFTKATSPASPETMIVELGDLNDVVDKLKEDDPTMTVAKLVGKTLEMTAGPGLGITLDPSRPEDKFDRFWLITKVEFLPNDQVKLTLKNPTAVDPTKTNVIAPDATSEYAITSLSINFFADEREQIDYMFVFDNDSVADDVGALTSSDGVVFAFDANTNTMRVDTSALQSAATLLGVTVEDLATLHKQIEITVGPGQGRVWAIASIADFNNDPKSGQKLLSLTDVSGSGTPTDRSEFRIAGSDRYGRITGFGMGPNILFAGKPQGGGITYGDLEVVQVNLGLGNDKVRVDYATNAEDHATKRAGDFYTLTMLNTGGGNDEVTVALSDGDTRSGFDGAAGDGAFSLDTGEGNDTVIGAASTRDLVVFGGLGQDDITTGSGADIVFGDVGRVDYVKTTTPLGGAPVDEVITRLGHSVPQNPVNPHVTGAESKSVSDSTKVFSDAYSSVIGLSVQAISPDGHVQFRTIVGVSDDGHKLFVDRDWDQLPVFGSADLKNDYYYRVSSYPEDQTDGSFRGTRLVWSIDETSGDTDTIHAGAGADIVIGGAGGDSIDSGSGIDQVAGDDARLEFAPVTGNDGPTRLVRIIDPGTIGNDTLMGGAEPDLLIGGLGDDNISGGANNDILIGDAATVDFAVDGITVNHILTTDRANGGIDTIYGGDNDDLIIGGAKADKLDGGANDDLIFGDNVELTLNVGSGDAVKPRFRTVVGEIYDPSGDPQVGIDGQPRPGGMPAWADWHITLDQLLTAANFGDDTIAGGANDDTIFGQRGDDKIQGDGSIAITVGWIRDANGLNVSGSAEAVTDGDDYIEGNAGKDLIFGNLGQDDLIGGSSTLFSLADKTRRDDGEDMIFGGAGTDLARNNLGDGSNGRDADMILGDNGNIYRLVSDGAYRQFNYDATYGMRIIPRAAELLDYTPGDVKYMANGAIDPASAALSDIGTADELHGESGDDFIYGMTGSDVLFGEGQDDDLIGGYGNDWISGGTGDDGVIGDDGRILTSRNSALLEPEPLNGVTTPVALDTTISTGGSVQLAVINESGKLKKAVNIAPFSQDPAWTPATYEFDGLTKGRSDDIIFGGWGNDFLHGGTGDDAISGAEALAESYAPTFSAVGVPDGTMRIDYDHPVNPANVLAFNPIDANGKSSNKTRAGEFYLYNEYDPLRRIMLDVETGLATTWTVTPVGKDYFLNFDSAATLLAQDAPTSIDPAKRTDGDDKIFGDLGNDWLVGGSGRDNLYGGFGNDLLNANDDLSTHNSLNDQPPVASASYEDRAFGGAGRDVLIANTGGDRLIDWTGEFNSYLVPFSPFGNATVSRTLQPALPEFLYALSASDGADPTRVGDIAGADPARNGEPYGELGLVLQKDAAWKDQHGGPADPQPGNIGGTKRDVLRSATFTNGAAQGFNAQVGASTVLGDRYQVTPAVSGGEAVSLFDQSDTVIPVYFEMQATINAVKATGGNKANAYLIFDWQSNTDFKFAGIDVSTNKLVVGHRTASAWVVDNWTNVQVKAGTDYVIMLKANNSTATAIIGNSSVSFTFAPRTDSQGVKHLLNDGITGVGTSGGASAQIDNVVVQKAPEPITVDITADFGSTNPASKLFKNTTAPTGSWVSGSDGRFTATSADINAAAINLASVGALPITAGSLLNITTTLKTSGMGGVVFDYQGPNYYKFVVLSADSKQILIGHRTGNAWITDASYAFNVSSSSDYQLGVSLRGGLVNVSINGAVLLSQIYAETVTAGGYGLISRKGASSGVSSFDIVQVKSDEGGYAPATPLLEAAAADPATLRGGGDTPSAGDLAALLAEAKARWAASGLDATSTAKLDAVTVRLADLPGAALGEEVSGTVFVDLDGAGRGWFIDPTPQDNAEFHFVPGLAEWIADADSPAFGRMDLLTVVTHEIGHVLGFDHGDVGSYDVMASILDPGVRFGADAIRIDAGAVALGGDLRRMMEATGWNAAQAASAGLPGFDLGSGPSNGIGNGNGSIDWQAPYGDSWSVRLSPYASKPAKSGASNVSDFLVKLFQGRTSGSASQGYDSLGNSLLGDKGKASPLGR